MTASCLAPILAAITAELGHAPDLPAADLATLAAAAAGDDARLKRWIKRRLSGEPIPYITGLLAFRGRNYRIDARAYITDPECSCLIDTVGAAITAFTARAGRAPAVAEVGGGCGSLAISLKLEHPAARVTALELNSGAIPLARENAAALGADVQFLESDLLDAWPGPAAPDLIFGDPPWGTEETLYAADRDAAYYHAMPAASAFPLGGATGMHAQILRAVAARRWPSHVILNGGVLPPAALAAVARGSRWHEVATSPQGVSVLHCRMC